MNDGIDQSWSYTDPAAAAAAGIKVVSGYLSNDSGKNWTRAHIDAYHAHGIGVILNWEQQAGAPLNGAAQGKADAAEAVKQAKALVAPHGTVIYFSCDKDVSSSQFPEIERYYQAAKTVCKAAGFGLGAYGEADLVAHLSAKGITDAEWQTLAWSGGRIDPSADFYQSSINNTLGGASVDFDRIIHAGQLGAWWPPGHEPDSGGDTKLKGGLMAENLDPHVVLQLRHIIREEVPALIKEQLARLQPYVARQIRNIVHQEIAKFTHLGPKDKGTHLFSTIVGKFSRKG